jgi:hypothetical protein
MHHNNIEQRDRLEETRKRMRGGKPGDDRSPPDTWKSYLYVSDETNKICIPTENLLAALLLGGMKVKMSGKETYKTHSQRIAFDRLDYDLVIGSGTIDKSSIESIQGEYLEHADAVRALGFRLQVKPASVGTTKHIRVRPLFAQWSVTGTFEIEADDASILGLSALRDIFTATGRLVGLGDWRPSSPKRPGQYGRFVAEIDRA